MRIATLMLLLLISPLGYGETNEEYWEKWNMLAEKTSECDSISSVVEFLELSLQHLGNAERNQANAEEIENLIISFPDCFCSAFIELSEDSQLKVKMFYLKAPLFNEKESIDEALFSNRVSRDCHAF